MIIICGKTIAEVERDLEMAKQAIASGMPYGVGGATIEDAERGLEMLSAIADNAPIDNPNYVPPHSCGCSCDYCTCNVCGGCEDEEEEEDVDICPECGADYDEGWDGESCTNCGYGEEDEDESIPTAIVALGEMLRYLGADENTIGELLS
jgi:hypothetical protein